MWLQDYTYTNVIRINHVHPLICAFLSHLFFLSFILSFFPPFIYFLPSFLFFIFRQIGQQQQKNIVAIATGYIAIYSYRYTTSVRPRSTKSAWTDRRSVPFIVVVKWNKIFYFPSIEGQYVGSIYW